MAQAIKLEAYDNSGPIAWRVSRLARLYATVEELALTATERGLWSSALIGLVDVEGELFVGWRDAAAKDRFAEMLEQEWMLLDPAGGIEHQLATDPKSQFYSDNTD